MTVGSVLQSLRVVELAEGIAGPMAGVRLGDLSAEVTKVEQGEGDWMRRCPPFLDDGETSAVFFALNRGKKSLHLDGDAGGGDAGAAGLLGQLARAADVFITDRTPEQLAALGLGELLEDRCSFNERLIVARISPWGAAGPLAGKPGSELCAQAMAGYTRYVSSSDRLAARLGADVAGVATGIFTTQAVLAALIERKRTGKGQRVDLSLLGSLLAMKTVHLAAQSDPDHFEGPRVGGAYDPPERGWRTADEPVTFAFGGAVGAGGRAGWESFVEAVGLRHLLQDDRFDKTGRATTGLGPRARELKAEYEAAFRRLPSSEVVAQVRKFGGFASAYLDHAELMREPQVEAMEVVAEAEGPGGPMAVLNFPARFSDASPQLRGGLARLGQHNEEVRAELRARRPAESRN